MFLCLCTLFLSSCKKEINPYIHVGQEEYYVDAAGGTVSLAVSANVELSYSASASWIVQSGTSVFRVEPNDTHDQRKGEIEIFNREKNVSTRVSVIQGQKDVLVIGQTEFHLGRPGGEISVTVSHNMDYGITTSDAWIVRQGTKALMEDRIAFTILPNESGASRSGAIVFHSGEGRISQTVSIVQDGALDLSEEKGGANCYIVSAPGRYKFPAEIGNSGIAIGEASAARIVWESYNEYHKIREGDLIKDLSYEDGYMYFTADENLDYGNAVVAVLDDNGTILWSWHIWLCRGYDPEVSAKTYPNGTDVVMDRNIGAWDPTWRATQSSGLLYQWGRKDPFFISQWEWMADAPDCMSTIGKSPTVPVRSVPQKDNATLQYAIEHPETFITSNNSPYDWYCTDRQFQNNELWDDNGKKTIYDPCPPGWRVPDGGPDGLWTRAGFDKWTLQLPDTDKSNYPMCIRDGLERQWWSTEKRGRLFLAADSWYSMPGCKRYFDGEQVSDGGYGVYWTRTTDDIFSSAMYFTFFGDVFPNLVNVRGYAYAVRCCKE